MIAAGFDQPAASRNLDFAAAVSARGVGFCDGELTSLASWYADSDTFDLNLRLARRMGSYFSCPDESATDEEDCRAVSDAAYF